MSETKSRFCCLVFMWWKAVLGTGIVLFAMREMFQDLFHPTQSGSLSDWVATTLFRLLRRRPSLLPSAGPLAVVITMFTWAALLVIGFAFIYWSVFPAEFQLRTVNKPTSSDGFWWCLYYSLEMLTTLGLGDIAPNPNWLRILSGCHTLIGFSLVTASVTWIILIFPALRRTRTLAHVARTLRDSECETHVAMVSPGMHVVLAGLAEDVIRARVDLVHFPILFYFTATNPDWSLGHGLLELRRVANQGVEEERDGLVRLSATALHSALDELTEDIGRRLKLSDTSPEDILAAFVELHAPGSHEKRN